MVGIYSGQEFNYTSAPFNPAEKYPELKDTKISLDEKNHVYNAVRNALCLAGYDSENFNTSKWNPLNGLVQPGQTVFIKPNMISQKHLLNNDWEYVITNGAVIRPIIDYLYLATGGNCRIIIGDAPQSDSKFNEIIKLMGLNEIRELYKNDFKFEIEIINLQNEHLIDKEGILVNRIPLPGDPRGSVKANLGSLSMFSEYDDKDITYYGAYYDIQETNFHHKNGLHEYLIARSPIIADVFINVPKLKTHKKCGITVNLKSLVGINANKNWLPHYLVGSPANGGDQFPFSTTKSKLENKVVIASKKMMLKNNVAFFFIARKLKKIAYKIFGQTEKVVRSGNWYGNDTVWRMCLDLNRVLMYCNPDGTFRSTPKKMLTIVDGFSAMEGNGPVAGTLNPAGVILCGDNPVSVDAACAKIMGLDYNKISIIKRAFDNHKYPLTSENYSDITVKSNNKKWDKKLSEINFEDSLKFKPHFGWEGHIEEK